ncbi:MAG: Modification methylase DpnIIB [Acidobacteria bacterium ADurb.Bin051]|nr:MAG: Modification methylase DpnIIB [Acidobacteria bacterium ADurb.Bin051]
MARKKTTMTKRPIESYEHKDKQRVNNPPVGLVTPDTDPDAGAKKTYAYDPHLDPQLQWAGKAEHTSFEVPTVSLHVHERIDPRTIIEAVKKKNGSDPQVGLFDTERAEPLREAVDFYKHAHGWSNRLVAGDSLLVMNSLLEKEGMAGKVQMVYLDPPYGIKYGSNFQPFVNKRDVKDGKAEDLTAEPEQIRAFRDTWELGIHSYLTYLRDRLLLARELLTESGSIFVQISDENVHHVRELMDEVFGVGNFIGMLSFKVTGGTQKLHGLPQITDFLIWFARDKGKIKFRRLFVLQELDKSIFSGIEETSEGHRRSFTDEEKEFLKADSEGYRFLMSLPMHSKGAGNNDKRQFNGKLWSIPSGMHWRHSDEGFSRLVLSKRVIESKTVLRSIAYFDDFPFIELTSSWNDTAPAINKDYVVQTSELPIQRCLLMTTDPGDLVFDPTCGSGTTAFVAEQWGRRWITCDTSRVALTLAKQRLMTAVFDYYELAHPSEGVGSGFKYKTVPHVTLKSIANNPDIKEGMTREQIDAAIARHAPQETLYDQPFVDRKKTRVSGPFTVEAVPAPAVKSVDELLDDAPQPADASIARSGETLRQGEWRDELQRTGIRGKKGQHIRFARLEPLPGCRWLHADGETRPSDEGADGVRETGPADSPQRIVVSFGPEHAPLEQRQVAQAIEEAQTLVPKPRIIVFAAFQFDPEAAKDIDETNWPGVTLLKAQMNADLLTDDLKKKRASNESFWLIGQPDVQVERIATGEDKGKLRVRVAGFDYYNTKTGGIESGGEAQIAVWMLDTDYDGRSLYPRQVFFPMAGATEGWARLAKNLKAEIDEELIEAYQGTVSLPFEPGEHRRIAVKIVDDRGIESLKVMEVE